MVKYNSDKKKKITRDIFKNQLISSYAVVECNSIGEKSVVNEFAVIRKGAIIGKNVRIHPHVVIESGVVLEDNVEVFPGCHLGEVSRSFRNALDLNGDEPTVHIGKNSVIGSNSVIGYDVSIGYNTIVGAGSFVHEKSKIGDFCILSHHVIVNYNAAIGDRFKILNMTHVSDYSHVENNNNDVSDGCLGDSVLATEIHDGAKIGVNATILSGVMIGSCSVVSPSAFVDKDVKPYQTVAGIPARVVKDLRGEKNDSDPLFHDLALVETRNVGQRTRIWAYTHILPGATIGKDCNICDHVFIENDVVIGNRVTIKSGVQIWDSARIEDGVFIGPNVTFTNDPFPRSRQYPNKFLPIRIKKGASVGANATLLPGITVGEKSLIGAGSVVTNDVPSNTLVIGNPARIVRKLEKGKR